MADQTKIDFDAAPAEPPSAASGPAPAAEQRPSSVQKKDYSWKVLPEKYRFHPGSTQPFKLSRSKLENFLRCARCFYLDRRLGVGQPSGPPFLLNSAVDTLLKKEFDEHRIKGTKHPICDLYGIDAVPFQDGRMGEWRENFVGVQALHRPTNLLIFGAVDDLWINPAGEVIVVDYKATATSKEISLDSGFGPSYKRQMEIYQWLLRQNGLTVSDTGYFVYCNGLTDKQAFDATLEFHVQLLPHTGKDDWVEDAIAKARACLMADTIPAANPKCDFCNYRQAATQAE